MTRLERSLLNIIVEGAHNEDAVFASGIPAALREYADAVERGLEDEPVGLVRGRHALEEMRASNGFVVRVIAGTYTCKDHGSSEMPLSSISLRNERMVESSA